MEQVSMSKCKKATILEGLEAVEKGETSEAFNFVEDAIEFLEKY